MKLIELANKIDKTKQNEDWIDTMEVGDELGLDDIPYVEQDRLKSYWLGRWLCTDTHVGYRMYFLDDEPVAMTVQTGRKSNENFHWFSQELAIKVRDYLLTLMDDIGDPTIKVCDINQDLGDSFKIEFSAQIINYDRVKLNNEPVVVLDRIKNYPYGIDTELKIKLVNGEEKQVNIEELDFGFHLEL